MKEYDVIVCGAGPSGSTAAKYLAENGLNVLLLDKSNFPRSKACGGGLCEHISQFKYILEKLTENDCDNDLLESICTQGVIFSPTLKFKTEYISDNPLFYNIRREKFDHELVKFAVNAGAKFRELSEVKEISIEPNKGAVKLANGEKISCKVIVGAGGCFDSAAKYLRKKEGLPEDWGRDLGFSVVEEFDVDEKFIRDKYGIENSSLIHLKHAELSGYGWVFAKNKLLNIGYIGFKHEIKKIDIKKEFNNYLELLKKTEYLPSHIKSKKLRGAPIPYQGPMQKTYSDRLVIIGDAAGFVSPLTGEGIHYAIDSGKIAAETILKAFEKDDFSAQTLKTYQDKWMENWGKDLLTLNFFQKRLMKWPEAIVKYGSKDEKLKKMFVGLYIGSESASKIKWKIIFRIVRDFFLYDIFRKK